MTQHHNFYWICPVPLLEASLPTCVRLKATLCGLNFRVTASYQPFERGRNITEQCGNWSCLILPHRIAKGFYRWLCFMLPSIWKDDDEYKSPFPYHHHHHHIVSSHMLSRHQRDEKRWCDDEMKKTQSLLQTYVVISLQAWDGHNFVFMYHLKISACGEKLCFFKSNA